MPYYHFGEIWTPLKLLGIRVYRDDNDTYWIKAWRMRRKKLG